jgi:hypothetical protein
MSVFNHVTPLFTNKKDIIIRHAIILVLGVFFGSLKVFNGDMLFLSGDWFRYTLFTFLMIATIWNGNVLFIDLLDEAMPWQRNIKQKIVISLLIAIGWPVIVHFGFNLIVYPIIFGESCNLNSKENVSFLIISVTVTLLVNAIFTAIAFFNIWRQSVKETEELKRESLSAEFETLKSQINPHFLFNALNTLTSLIEEHPKQATDFVLKLSSVYRYVLTQKDKQLVTLKEELDFIEAYIYLNQIRFGSNLIVSINVPAQFYHTKLVTLALQMLVENCIKHNVISAQHPLTIQLYIEDDRLVVKNNLQKKQQSMDSNGIGLNNIVHRYGFITDKKVEITEDGTSFIVSLPLIFE